MTVFLMFLQSPCTYIVSRNECVDIFVYTYIVSRNECVDIFVYVPIFVYTFCIYSRLFLVFFTFSLLHLSEVRVDHLKKLQLPPVDYNCPYLASAGVGYHC